uniref:Uncharacterized protein LOC102803240 n=1 Tax=Saccoglossus kowalevskii TaxID=10224 RepID=A0ABM0MSP0_SACKO|nr:PREDICTED: uncharacterized protein LOC102803240 [Saccoglossus kowalevskii]
MPDETSQNPAAGGADLEVTILDLTPDDDFDSVSEASGDYQADIYDKKHSISIFVKKHRKLESVKSSPEPSNENAATDASTTSSSTPTRTAISLPKLQLQTFSGNVVEWHSFYDIFKSTIHADTSLDPVQKFTYLRSMLQGEAADTIARLTLTDGNYCHAIDLLVERYGQTHQIIDAHTTALWTLAKHIGDVKSLRHFYDQMEIHVRGLQSLGKEENSYGELLVPMIRDKIPQNIRLQIAHKHGNSIWTLKQLRAAILQEINALSAGDPLQEVSSLTLEPVITAAFHTSTQSPRIQKLCPFCSGNHFASTCTVVRDTNRRLDIVKRDRLCFNCLDDDPTISEVIIRDVNKRQ